MRYGKDFRQNFVVCCISFLMFFGSGYAQNLDTLFVQDWEGDWFLDWSSSAGTWEVGIPTSGPGGAHNGQKVAATVLAGNYSEPTDTRLMQNFPFTVPDASLNPRLRFWHWYSFSSGDNGRVQISTDNGATWQTISPIYENTGSNTWSQPYLDLSDYGGSSIIIAFYFHSQQVGSFGNVSSGWYLDDVGVVTGPVTFNNPEDFESGIGDWNAERGTWEVGIPTSGPGGAYLGQFCAGTNIQGNYSEPVDSRLTSPPFVVPSASENPRLRFYHWFNFASGDYGQVQVSADNGITWQPISIDYTNSSSGVWSYPKFDLSDFEGQTISVAFYFHSQQIGSFGNVNTGWYIDNLEIITGPVVFNNPEDFETGIGEWYVSKGTWEVGQPTVGPSAAHSPPNCAGTKLDGNYSEPVDSKIITPPVVISNPNAALRFWHWYSFSSGDYGQVQIRVENQDWEVLSTNFTNTSSGVWTPYFKSLSAYFGLTVQIAFHFHSEQIGSFSNVSTGWYVDDVEITGIAPEPEIIVVPNSVDFGNVLVNQSASANITVSNTGGSVLEVSDISTNGINAVHFDVEPNTPFSLPAGQSQALVITFTPPTAGAFSATLQISSNDTSSSVVEVPLSGTGFIPLPPDTITVAVDTVAAFPGDTVLVPVSAIFPPDSSFSSMEMDLSGFQDHLELIEIVTENTLTGDANWTYQVNPTDSLLLLAAAGSTEISGSGVLFYLKLYVPMDAEAGMVSVTPDNAIFDTGNTFVTLVSGGVDIGLLPFYGDVDLNTLVQAFDASVILKYLVGEEPLNPQQMLNANVSLDTTISTWDASLILKYVVGLIDTLPYDSVLVTSGSISMADTLDANPNELVDVPIWADGLQNISGMEFRIEYDPAQATIQEIVWPSSFQDTSFKTYNDSANGIFRIAVVSDSLIAHPDAIIATLRCKTSPDFTETTVSVNRLRLNEDIPTFDVAMTVLKPIVGISDGDQRLPREYALDQNYPNPFNPETAIRYHLPQSEHVKLTVYNMLGQEIRVLVNEPGSAGSYSVRWDGRDAAGQKVASGIYIYKMTAGNFIAVQKMLLMQ